MILMPKNAKKYYCEKCDFICIKESNWKQHLLTRKHCSRTLLNDIEQNNAVCNKLYTCDCGKQYSARNSLWYHKKKCYIVQGEENYSSNNNNNNSSTDTDIDIDKELLIKMLLKNQDVIEGVILKNQDVMEKMMEIMPRIGNKTNIHNNKHNNQYNNKKVVKEKKKNVKMR